MFDDETDETETTSIVSLYDFKNWINELDDLELLDAGSVLFRDMIEIQNMKERIELMEDELYDDKKAAFAAFTLGLSGEQITLAAGTVKGRAVFLRRKAADLAAKNAASEEVTEEE